MAFTAVMVTAMACVALRAVAACLRAAAGRWPTRIPALVRAIVTSLLRLRSARGVTVEPSLRQVLSEQPFDLLQQ